MLLKREEGERKGEGRREKEGKEKKGKTMINISNAADSRLPHYLTG